jgi:hypothetical protein
MAIKTISALNLGREQQTQIAPTAANVTGSVAAAAKQQRI